MIYMYIKIYDIAGRHYTTTPLNSAASYHAYIHHVNEKKKGGG